MNRYIANFSLAATLALAAPFTFAQDAVKSLADDWAKAYNAYDKAALGALYTEDARLMMHGSPTVVGREAITSFWAGDFQEGDPKTVLTVTHFVEGIDYVLVHGDYKVVNKADETEVMGAGRFAHIWVEEANGSWKLDRDLWNQPYEPITAQ